MVLALRPWIFPQSPDTSGLGSTYIIGYFALAGGRAGGQVGSWLSVDCRDGFRREGQIEDQHPARVPVDDGHQIGETVRQADVGDVGAPHRVRARDYSRFIC